MKYVAVFVVLSLLSVSANQEATAAENKAPVAEAGRTVPLNDMAEVVNKLMALTGTEAKMDLIAKNAVKEFNEKHAEERLITIRLGISDVSPKDSDYELTTDSSDLPRAFFHYKVPSMYGKTEMFGGQFLHQYRMCLTEKEIMAIEKADGKKKPTSFIEVSGNWKLVYGGSIHEALPGYDGNGLPGISKSGKAGCIANWTIPAYSGNGKQLYLVLKDLKTKLILPAR